MPGKVMFNNEYSDESTTYQADLTWPLSAEGPPFADLYVKFPRNSTVPPDHEYTEVRIETDGATLNVHEYHLHPNRKTTPQGMFSVYTHGFRPSRSVEV